MSEVDATALANLREEQRKDRARVWAPGTGHWMYGLDDCMDTRGSTMFEVVCCAASLVVPLFAYSWATTEYCVEDCKINNDEIYGICCLVHIVTAPACFVTAPLRRRAIRARHLSPPPTGGLVAAPPPGSAAEANANTSCATDCAVALCCCPCASIQEARQAIGLKRHDMYRAMKVVELPPKPTQGQVSRI